MIEVTQSLIRDWRTCHRNYHYKWVENIEKKKNAIPLYRGSMIHEIIEAKLEGKDWKGVLTAYQEEYDNLFVEEKAEFGDIPGEVKRIMKAYFREYKDDKLRFMTLGGKKSEHKVKVELVPGKVIFKGKLDAIAEDDHDRVWLVEHKSHKKFPTEDFRFTNLQVAIYSWALEQQDKISSDGILWNYIRTKPPIIPDLLKNGELSKRKNIDTDWVTYLGEIKKHGLNPKDYADMKELLTGNRPAFFRRVFFPISEKVRKNIVNDFKETALEIYSLGGKSKARNLGRHCSWCSFNQVCHADLAGLDVNFILKHEYKEREDRYKEELETEDED